METNSARPSKLLAYVAVIVGGLLLLSGTVSFLSYLTAPFGARGRDILTGQLGQMAVMFLGLVCGSLALYHGITSIRNQPSHPMRLPPFYIFWIVFALALGLGHVLVNFHIVEQFLFPPLFLLGSALPVLSVLAWAMHRLGAPITWRQGALAIVAGSTLSILIALVLEMMWSLVAWFLVPPLHSLMDTASSDFLTRLVFSPIVIVFLISTALQAPIPEEFSKALSAILFGKRITNERQAFAIGMFCGAGFAILENMLYEGIYAAQGGWGWGGVTLLRGIGAVLHPIGAGLVTLGWFRARKGGWLKLFGAYALAVGLHTLWNGGFIALVYLTGLDYYSKSAVLSLYGAPIQISLVAFLVALSLGLWGLLRAIVAGLAKGIEPDLSPSMISRRAVAVWAFACALVMVVLGATLGSAWSQIQPIILAGWSITR